jgi:hypothetical protein
MRPLIVTGIWQEDDGPFGGVTGVYRACIFSHNYSPASVARPRTGSGEPAHSRKPPVLLSISFFARRDDYWGTAKVGLASTPAAGLQTRSRFPFAAHRDAGRPILAAGHPDRPGGLCGIIFELSRPAKGEIDKTPPPFSTECVDRRVAIFAALEAINRGRFGLGAGRDRRQENGQTDGEQPPITSSLDI